MSDKPIDLAAERARRAVPETCDHVTRITFAELFFGTGEATDADPPMVMMAAFGGAFVMEEKDARRVGEALIQHANEIMVAGLRARGECLEPYASCSCGRVHEDAETEKR